MLLAMSSQIKEIDKYSAESLGIPVLALMEKAGSAVAKAVRERTEAGKSVVIFAGKGNNGGDGYAAAAELLQDYGVTVFDVFSSGQKSCEGQHFLDKYVSMGGAIRPLEFNDEDLRLIKEASCVVDAIFGTGFKGDVSPEIRKLSRIITELVDTQKIAVDVPIGINADDGSIDIESACTMNATVSLSFGKPGLVSYPAKAYVGDLIFDDLGLPHDKIAEQFDFVNHYVDIDHARTLIPTRDDNSNKGTFGKLLVITGSNKYRGAAHLSLEAALRGGAGLVTYVGEEELVSSLSNKFPEAIYKTVHEYSMITDDEIASVVDMSQSHSAVLIGSGSSHNPGLLKLVKALLSFEGSPVILDADAINVLADDSSEGRKIIQNSARPVVITPHPLEFSRISGKSVSFVQSNRISVAKDFAKENKCIVVLKGAATVTTDGECVYINSSGSSALAKAGSGDVLAGFLASLCAGGMPLINAAVMAVFYHGEAADKLAVQLSELGVTPSDLPQQIARCVAMSSKK